MMLKRMIGQAILLGIMAAVPRAGEPVNVALMVHRPDNRLAWNAHNDATGYLLGCDALLRRFAEREPLIRKVGPYRINGIVQAMDSGLYFPEGETLYAKWRPFLEADVFIEADISERRLQWRGGTADGDVYRSEEIAFPYRHPMAGAKALIRTVFAAAGAALPEGWEAELGTDEPSPPDLFIEWAKWIGYQPHWAHHAPWIAPQQSAMRILTRDPAFGPGAAWAIGMILRDGSGHHHRQGEQPSPASALQIPAAIRLLVTPFADAAYPFLRKFLPDSGLLNDAMKLLDLPLLDLGAAIEPGAQGLPGRAGPVDFDAMKKQLGGPLLRRNLIEAIGPLARDTVREALGLLVSDEPDADARAAAARMLGAHHAGPTDALRKAFETDPAGGVRAAALAALIAARNVQDGDIARAVRDPVAEVRRMVVDRVHEAPISDAARQTLWIQLLDDADAGVQAAAARRLREHTALAPGDPAVREPVGRLLASDDDAVTSAVLGWLAERADAAFTDRLEHLLTAPSARIRAGAARALFRAAPRQAAGIVRALRDDPSGPVQNVLAGVLAEGDVADAAIILQTLLARSRPAARDALLAAVYRMAGTDRGSLARAMRFDDALIVNLAGLRLAERLGDAALLAEILPACADDHPNPYLRAEALRVMERTKTAGLHERCLAGIRSPYWVVRLEAADILARIAGAADAAPLRAALDNAENEWLRLALEDALARAENRPRPERIRLGLGERQHTEGGNEPRGFQVWLGRMPDSAAERRRQVDAGYRFGGATRPPNFPGGTGLNSYNRSEGLRNQYLIESVLGEIEQRADALPYLYYLALFDEPCGPGRSGIDGMRAMVLLAGRPDLLPALAARGEDGLPDELRRAFEWYDARLAAEGSNWVVHMFRLTAQRKYQDLKLFPQSLSYMGTQMKDAFHLIDADGDYTWQYHHHNVFRDGAIGAVNRVLHPGKPLNAITWMGWHQINVLRGNTLTLNSDYPDQPWRMRNYMGTRSALALWASGTEPGFFTGVSFAKVSDPDGRSHSPGATGGVFDLKPWSAAAREAVAFMLDDDRYWRDAEAKLALEIEKPQPGQIDRVLESVDKDGPLDLLLDDDDALDRFLSDRPTKLQETVQAKKQAAFERLMRGIAYMNLFNTDTTRILSSLPKPDQSLRDTLLIMGRDSAYNQDAGSFPMPAIAVVQGFDMLPTYDGIGRADLMHYDTILLRASRDGVTAELIEHINRWLRERDGGLLVVWGDVNSQTLLFPELTLDTATAPFAWESSVRITQVPRIEEVQRDRQGREVIHPLAPRLDTLHDATGTVRNDDRTRREWTLDGDIEPLIKTGGGDALLARWKAPADIRATVLFDGAGDAGPVYTEALEAVILDVDRARGSTVTRNPWWGHLSHESEAFVVDVASRGFTALQAARPRRHQGIDLITGVINPEVVSDSCAVIFKDSVGPYAGARGNWAVLARRALGSMTVENADRLAVEAEGVTRVTRIGPEPIRLARPDGFELVADQIEVWRLKQEGRPAYSVNPIEGGHELHVFSPEPFTVVTGGQ